MCGRFALSVSIDSLIAFFGLDACVDFPANLNIAPGTDIPVIRRSPEGHRVLHLLHWGLLPHWVKQPDTASRPINARIETVREKPYFRDAYRKRRCLIPAECFYEWAQEGKRKQAYRIALDTNTPMAMAGLWESWTAPDGTILRSVCIVTTEAIAVMQPIHDRMPLLLEQNAWAAWLSGDREDVDPQYWLAASAPSLRITALDKLPT